MKPAYRTGPTLMGKCRRPMAARCRANIATDGGRHDDEEVGIILEAAMRVSSAADLWAKRPTLLVEAHGFKYRVLRVGAVRSRGLILTAYL